MSDSIGSLILDKAQALLLGKLKEQLSNAIKKSKDDENLEEYYSSVFDDITASIPDEWEREQLQNYVTKFAPIQVDKHYSMFSDEMRKAFIDAFYSHSSLHYRSEGIEKCLQNYLDELEKYLSFELKDKLFFDQLTGLSSGQQRIENSVQEVLRRLPDPSSFDSDNSTTSLLESEVRIKPDIDHSDRKSHVILRNAFALQMEGAFDKIIKLAEEAIETETREERPDIHTLLYAKSFLVHYYLTVPKYHEKASATLDELLSVEIIKHDPTFYRDTLLEKAKLLLGLKKTSQARAVLEIVDNMPKLTKTSQYYEAFGMLSLYEGNLSEAESFFTAGMNAALGQHSTAVDPEEKATHLQHYWSFLTFLGTTYQMVNRPDLGLTMWKKAIDASSHMHFEQHKTSCVLSYVECLLQYERYSEACAYLDKIHDTLLSIQNFDLMYLYYNLKADAYLGLGDSDSAISTLVEVLKSGMIPDHAISILQRVAKIEASQGKQDVALETLNTAQQIAEQITHGRISGIRQQEEDIKDSRMFLDGKVHPSISPPDTNTLQQLISHFHTSEIAAEQLQLSFDIGVSQIDSNPLDSDKWLTKTIQIARKLGNKYIEARALSAKASILLSSKNEQAEIDANRIIDQGIELVRNFPFWDVYARLMMLKGMSCAHFENYHEALQWFKKAANILNDHYVDDQILKDYVSDGLDACQDILSRLQYTDIDFDMIIQEIDFFSSWLPEYRKEMIQFLWYNRHEDIERLIISSHGSKALMVSDNAEDIQNWSTQLDFLFDTVSFCSQSDYHTKDNWNFAKFLPLPKNMISKFFNYKFVFRAQ